MAKHRPVHARSGLGRYTPPRRLHPAHAAASTRRGALRVSGIALGGGILVASLAGLGAVGASPAGAIVEENVCATSFCDVIIGPGTVGPTHIQESSQTHDNTVNAKSSGVENALVAALAGSTLGTSSHNSAHAVATDIPGATGSGDGSAAQAEAGTNGESSHNHATAEATGIYAAPGIYVEGGACAIAASNDSCFDSDAPPGSATPTTDAHQHHDTANAFAFGGLAEAMAGTSTGDTHDFAQATATLGEAYATAASGDFNRAIVTVLAGEGIAEAGDGDHNTAIVNEAGLDDFAIALAGQGHNNDASAVEESPDSGDFSFAAAGEGHDDVANAGALEGDAAALAGQGSHDEASATAVLGGEAGAVASDGDHQQANAEAFGAASANAVATGSGGFAQTSSTLGSGAVATSSDGNASVSFNGETLNYG